MVDANRNLIRQTQEQGNLVQQRRTGMVIDSTPSPSVEVETPAEEPIEPTPPPAEPEVQQPTELPMMETKYGRFPTGVPGRHVTLSDIDEAVRYNQQEFLDRTRQQQEAILHESLTLYNPLVVGTTTPFIDRINSVTENNTPSYDIGTVLNRLNDYEPPSRDNYPLSVRPTDNLFSSDNKPEGRQIGIGDMILGVLGIPEALERGLFAAGEEKRQQSLARGGSGTTIFGMDVPRWLEPITNFTYTDQRATRILGGQGLFESLGEIVEGVVTGQSPGEILRNLQTPGDGSTAGNLAVEQLQPDTSVQNMNFGAYGTGLVGLLNRTISVDDVVRATLTDISRTHSNAVREATRDGGFDIGRYLTTQTNPEALGQYWRGDREFSFLSPQGDEYSGMDYTPIRRGQQGTFIPNPFGGEDIHIPFIPGWATGLALEFVTGAPLPALGDIAKAARLNTPRVPIETPIEPDAVAVRAAVVPPDVPPRTPAPAALQSEAIEVPAVRVVDDGLDTTPTSPVIRLPAETSQPVSLSIASNRGTLPPNIGRPRRIEPPVVEPQLAGKVPGNVLPGVRNNSPVALLPAAKESYSRLIDALATGTARLQVVSDINNLHHLREGLIESLARRGVSPSTLDDAAWVGNTVITSRDRLLPSVKEPNLPPPKPSTVDEGLDIAKDLEIERSTVDEPTPQVKVPTTSDDIKTKVVPVTNDMVDRVVAAIKEVDRDLNTENYVPFHELRKRLPDLTRDEFDNVIYKLERNDVVRTSTLVESIHYTAEDIQAGIPQLSGGPVFFVSLEDGADDLLKTIKPDTVTRQQEVPKVPEPEVPEVPAVPTETNKVGGVPVVKAGDTVNPVPLNKQRDYVREVVRDLFGVRSVPSNVLYDMKELMSYVERQAIKRDLPVDVLQREVVRMLSNKASDGGFTHYKYGQDYIPTTTIPKETGILPVSGDGSTAMFDPDLPLSDVLQELPNRYQNLVGKVMSTIGMDIHVTSWKNGEKYLSSLVNRKWGGRAKAFLQMADASDTLNHVTAWKMVDEIPRLKYSDDISVVAIAHGSDSIISRHWSFRNAQGTKTKWQDLADTLPPGERMMVISCSSDRTALSGALNQYWVVLESGKKYPVDAAESGIRYRLIDNVLDTFSNPYKLGLNDIAVLDISPSVRQLQELEWSNTSKGYGQDLPDILEDNQYRRRWADDNGYTIANNNPSAWKEATRYRGQYRPLEIKQKVLNSYAQQRGKPEIGVEDLSENKLYTYARENLLTPEENRMVDFMEWLHPERAGDVALAVQAIRRTMAEVPNRTYYRVAPLDSDGIRQSVPFYLTLEDAVANADIGDGPLILFTTSDEVISKLKPDDFTPGMDKVENALERGVDAYIDGNQLIPVGPMIYSPKGFVDVEGRLTTVPKDLPGGKNPFSVDPRTWVRNNLPEGSPLEEVSKALEALGIELKDKSYQNYTQLFDEAYRGLTEPIKKQVDHLLETQGVSKHPRWIAYVLDRNNNLSQGGNTLFTGSKFHLDGSVNNYQSYANGELSVPFTRSQQLADDMSRALRDENVVYSLDKLDEGTVYTLSDKRVSEYLDIGNREGMEVVLPSVKQVLENHLPWVGELPKSVDSYQELIEFVKGQSVGRNVGEVLNIFSTNLADELSKTLPGVTYGGKYYPLTNTPGIMSLYRTEAPTSRMELFLSEANTAKALGETDRYLTATKNLVDEHILDLSSKKEGLDSSVSRKIDEYYRSLDELDRQKKSLPPTDVMVIRRRELEDSYREFELPEECL